MKFGQSQNINTSRDFSALPSTTRVFGNTPRGIQLCAWPASTPPFSERSKILNSVRPSNLAWLPPTVYSNCSERLWLHARTFLVALENRVGWPGESNWGHTPPLFPFSTYASIVAAKTRIQRCPCNYWWNLAISYGRKTHDI